MFKLIYKDILVNKRYFKSMLIFSLIFPLISVINGGSINASYVSVIMCGFTFFVMAVESEERTKTYRIINSLPINRKTTVYARYIGSLLISTLFMSLLCLLFYFLSIIPSSPFTAFNYAKLLEAITTVLIMSSIVMCVTYCFGYMAARIANFVVFFPVIFILTAFQDKDFMALGKLFQILRDTSLNMLLIKLSIGILVYLLSMVIAVTVYDQRDL